MPNAVPAAAAAALPPARMIDPRGHRFGAGVSAVLLIIATVVATDDRVTGAPLDDTAECPLRNSASPRSWYRLEPAILEHGLPQPERVRVIGVRDPGADTRIDIGPGHRVGAPAVA